MITKLFYKQIFERYPLYPSSMPALEIGAWNNLWLKGDQITYMDREKMPNSNYPDVVHDLEDTPLPFKDYQFGLIAMREVLEHVCPKKQPIVMHELARILKPSGKLILTVPYYQWEGAHSTPDHCKYFTKHSFDQYLEDCYNGEKLFSHLQIFPVREGDRLKYMPIETGGHRIKTVWMRKLLYRTIAPFQRQIRNLFVVLLK